MKKLFWFFIGPWVVLSLFLAQAEAADVTFGWDASVGATGYKIYKSEDMGATWDTGLDVGLNITFTYPGVREDIMVLFRVSAYNAVGESIRYWSGAWYDHRLRPVSDPGGTGIE